ncbi:hypothetical protein FRC02_011088 [Tulasnella sp. 418]|nr:hypothetical protein FRC02_011088 [Tulasnella sp. 418]
MTSFLEATFQLTLNTNGSSSSVIQSGDLKAIFSSSKEAVEVACKALQSVYSGDECMAICPNADLSGLGVKVAFYLQSILNATLVIFCPGEGASGAWSSAVLTAALVIPASIQLFQKDITLYHANLVLLFATLSTVTSLAVAPIIPIWRQGVSSELGEINTRQWREELEETPEAGPLTEKAFNERTGRVVLAVALLFQMIMQWMWCLFLWGLPGNFSGACSGETRFFWPYAGMGCDHGLLMSQLCPRPPVDAFKS